MIIFSRACVLEGQPSVGPCWIVVELWRGTQWKVIILMRVLSFEGINTVFFLIIVPTKWVIKRLFWGPQILSASCLIMVQNSFFPLRYIHHKVHSRYQPYEHANLAMEPLELLVKYTCFLYKVSHFRYSLIVTERETIKFWCSTSFFYYRRQDLTL